MPSSGYTAITFVANEQPTTAKWNLIGSNDASFNSGDGFEDDILQLRHIPDGLITPVKRTGGFKIGKLTISTTGNKVVTGVGFTPKLILFLMSTEATPSSSANAGLSIGAATDPAEQANVRATTRHSHGGAAETEQGNAFEISTISAGGGGESINVGGDLVSMDADGFTINAGVVGTTRDLIYICLA